MSIKEELSGNRMRESILRLFNSHPNPMKTAVHLPTQASWDRYMKWAEEKGWKWYGGQNPTIPEVFDTRWDKYKDKSCVDFNSTIQFGYKSWYKDNGYKIISLEEAIGEQGEQFVEGEEVLVRNSESDQWVVRVYLHTYPKGMVHRHSCVDGLLEDNYKVGDTYISSHWKYIKKKSASPIKMTVQEVCDKLGYEVEIVK